MKLRAGLLTIALFCGVCAPCQAEMPEALLGTWVLDAQASEALMKTSPKWTEEDAKFLPMIFKRMARVTYVITDTTITAAMGERKQAMDVTLTSSDGNVHVFATKLRDKDITMTATITEDGNLNLKSSATDDMDYYLWKKAEAEKSEK